MKVNKLFICLLLLVLTISAVSASDNMTEDLSLDEEAIVDSSIDDANQASQIEEDVSTADDKSDSVLKGVFLEDYYIDDSVHNVSSDPFATFDENDGEIVEGEAINFIAHFPNGDEKDYDVEAYVDGNKIYIDWLSYGDEYGYYRDYWGDSRGFDVGKHVLEVRISNESAKLSNSFDFYIKGIIVGAKSCIDLKGSPYEMNYGNMVVRLGLYESGTLIVLNNEKEIYREKVYKQNSVSRYDPIYDSKTNHYVKLDESNLNCTKKDALNHIVVRFFDGNNTLKYSEEFNVSVRNGISLENKTIVFGDSDFQEYYVHVPYDYVKNKLTVKIDNKVCKFSYDSWVDNEKRYSVDISNLDIGKHNITVSYAGDERFYPDIESAIIDCIGRIEVYDHNWLYNGKNNNVSLRLPAKACGNLTVFVDGRQYESQRLINGWADISLTELIGPHNISAEYLGSDYEIDPVNGSVDVEIAWDYHLSPLNGKVNFAFDFPSFANGEIVVLFNNKTYSSPVINGSYNIQLDNPSKIGEYDVEFSYAANNQTFNGTKYITIGPQFIVPAKVTNGKGSIVINATGGTIGNDMIYVHVYNKYDSYEFKFYLKNEKTVISLAKLNAGTYNVEIKYCADEWYTAHESYKIKVTNSKLTAKDLTKYYGSSSAFKVKVQNYKGKIVKNAKVKFYINGKYIKTVKTNKNGYATLKIAKAPGKYDISVKYGKVVITRHLTVKHAVTLKTVTVKKSAKKLVLKATVKAGKKPLKYKKITFKFNGKTYKAKTNKKGIAKVTIKKAVLKKLKVGKTVKYQATYLKDTVKKSAKVKK